MRTEIAAGGVVCSQGYVLLIQDMNDNWTFPKGLVEPSESLEEAAAREILEETSIHVGEPVARLSSVQYTFDRDGIPTQKTVHYFLFLVSTHADPKPQITEGISKTQFVPFMAAHTRLGYKETNLPLLREAEQYIQTHL